MLEKYDYVIGQIMKLLIRQIHLLIALAIEENDKKKLVIDFAMLK